MAREEQALAWDELLRERDRAVEKQRLAQQRYELADGKRVPLAMLAGLLVGSGCALAIADDSRWFFVVALVGLVVWVVAACWDVYDPFDAP